MQAVELDRDEWVAVARELDTKYGASAPAGLRERIAALLRATPAAWSGQALTLELDDAAADVVRRIVRIGRGQPEHPGLAHAQSEAVAEAEGVLWHAAQAAYRLEHRAGGTVAIVGRTSSADARQAELSRVAERLIANGATGELVLVEEATGREVARRRLLPEPRPDDGAGR